MSVTWRPAPPPPLCRCKGCDRAGLVMITALGAAFVSMAFLLMKPSLTGCAVTGGLLAVMLAALYWPCPRRRRNRRRRGDMEALIRATREPAAAPVRERAGQRFTGLNDHFDEWAKELKQP